MNNSLAKIVLAVSFGAFATAAGADVITGTITADNHYALYSSTGGVFTYHGGNELGSGGSVGSYNWSAAEEYTFEAADFLYLAVWSDDSVAQGALAQFQSDSLGVLLSGDPRWQVFGTGVHMGDGSAHPAALDIAGHVSAADANSAWEDVYAGDFNGSPTWGAIAGIASQAQWMWRNYLGDSDPLRGSTGNPEMLVFRSAVPTPASFALIGIAGLVSFRRRR